jgi:mRNA interferase HicA
LTYREVAAKLRRLGCDELPRRGPGSHRKWHNPRTGGSTVLPDWGGKDLKMGTVRAVVRALDLNWDTFVRA